MIFDPKTHPALARSEALAKTITRRAANAGQRAAAPGKFPLWPRTSPQLRAASNPVHEPTTATPRGKDRFGSRKAATRPPRLNSHKRAGSE